MRFLVDMLNQMISWVDEVPPLEQSNQRFGNLAFRSYYRLIEQVGVPFSMSEYQITI